MLKYRLYDVDVVIRKTLVYGDAVPALLGATYVFVVIGLQTLLASLDRGGLDARSSRLDASRTRGALPAVSRCWSPAPRLTGRFYRRHSEAQRALAAFIPRFASRPHWKASASISRSWSRRRSSRHWSRAGSASLLKRSRVPRTRLNQLVRGR